MSESKIFVIVDSKNDLPFGSKFFASESDACLYVSIYKGLDYDEKGFRVVSTTPEDLKYGIWGF